jgi:hypothetical protein
MGAMSAWTYQDAPVNGYRLRTVRARSLMPLYAHDGQLVHASIEFRDHALRGRQAHLQLEAGGFDCGLTCDLRFSTDIAAPWRERAGPVDGSQVLALRDARALWWRLRGAHLMTLRVPVSSRREALATFDLSTLDRSRLPWDEAAVARRQVRADTLQRAADA